MVNGVEDVEALIERAAAGDAAARQEILAKDRGRLRIMAARVIDRRLSSRVDPSDIVQEALADATRQLPRFLAERPLPTSAWLWRLTWERVIDAKRRHVLARRRSVVREESWEGDPGRAGRCPAQQEPADSGSSPSQVVVQEEQAQQLRQALATLPDRDRDLLVGRFLQRRSLVEIAAELGISVGAVMTRQTRALDRLRARLTAGRGGDDE